MRNVNDLTDAERLTLAISFATKSHEKQIDKAGKPYIFHPLRVMLHLIDEPVDVQIVAVLHDVVEDCEVSLRTLEVFFGPVIADAVDSVSRRIFLDGTKELYVDFVQRSKANEIGCKVKLADLKDNLSPARLGVLPEAERGVSKRYEKAVIQLNS